MPDEVLPVGAVGQRQPAAEAGAGWAVVGAQDGSGQAMQMALAAAREAGAAGEVPVGAVVTDAAGRVLAVCGNRMQAEGDASAHAELLAMRAAAKRLGTRLGNGRLVDCDLWVTLEPCAMCAAAAGLFRVRRIVFAAYDPKGGGIEHGPRIFATSPHLHQPEIVAGVREQEAAFLLQEFFHRLRVRTGKEAV